MPDFDLEKDIDETLAGGAKPAAAPDFDLEADIDATLAAAPAPEPTRPKSHVIEMPTQTIEYDPDIAKPAPQPWYSRLLPSDEQTKAVVHGAAQGATMNWGDEGAAALSSGLSAVLPGVSDPEGYERQYKSGSQYADMRNVLDAENTQLRRDHPGAFVAGQLVGAAPAAIATGAGLANVVRPVLGAGLGLGAKGAGLVEAGLGGALTGAAASSGTAQPGERLKEAGKGAVEGAAVGSALHGAGQGLQDVADNASNVANRLLVQTFMTPAQRAKYEIAKGGPKALDKLGQESRDAGLFGGKLRQLLPTRAKTVANNAGRVMQNAGSKISEFEDSLSQRGVNPDVDIRPIVDDLRAAAAEKNVPALNSSNVVDTINKGADLLEQPTSASVAGKIERPPALPEWSLNKTKQPQYGAAIEPQQEPLPGTEFQTPAATLPRPLPPAPEQLAMDLPRVMPSQQLSLNLPPRNRLAYSPEPAQLEMDLPRQQPSQQLSLGLEPQQAKLPLPPAEAAKRTRPEMTLDTLPVRLPSGGAAQENMFLGSEPARPPATPPRAPGAEQLSLDLPARQVPMNLGPSRPNPFRPEARGAEQLNLPVQGELPLGTLAPKPVPAPVPAPAPANPLAGRQEALALENPNRGPQPELSTELPTAQAQIARESLPLSDAMRLKRFLSDEINWTQNPNRAGTRAEEIVNKTSWKGIGDQIDSALKGDTRVDPAELAGYGKAKRDFHAAATAFDPALKMAEREGEVGLGARDMLAAGAFGGDPITGGLAAMASKNLAGVLPSTAASAVRLNGAVAGGLAPILKGAAKVSPVTLARQNNPGASEPEVKREANTQVKKDLQILLERRK